MTISKLWSEASVVAGVAVSACAPSPTQPSGSTSQSAAATQVTVAGSLQSELGCPEDWQPACAATHLAIDPTDGIWQRSFDLPAGGYEYKAAIDDSWDINYGANATPNGASIVLDLAAPATVKFYYDDATHWITDNVNTVIATAPGSYQSELGCPGDWQPDCLRSWLQDPDGDGSLRFITGALPAGNYEVKIAIDESWIENYGAGGVQNGANIPFAVTADCVETLFTYDPVSHVLDVTAAPPPPQPASVTVAGSLQSELGCPDDWRPDCATTFLGFDAIDRVWQATFDVPAGNWEYKAALNSSWDENYGANATRDGPNILLDLAAAAPVKFYFDAATHWITDDRTQIIATAPGSYQSELGCPGDWQPDCLLSWLKDPDGDGIYTFSTRSLPAGNYEVKVAIAESWIENYGAGGAQNGANIPFTVPASCAEMLFAYDSASHILTVGESSHSLCGGTYYDGNASASRDLAELGIEGWRVSLAGNGVTLGAETDADGQFTFDGLAAGDYVLCEESPTETIWLQTAPAGGCFTVHVPSSEAATCELDFGNLCLGAGGGHAPGFWANHNGEIAFMDDDGGATALALLQALDLWNDDGTPFEPTSYLDVRTWLKSRRAVNAAHTLSGQLAAMELNVLRGYVEPDALIYAPGCASSNALGFATVAAVTADARAELGLHGYTPRGSPFRAYQLLLQDALARANKNESFVQADACAHSFASP